MESWIIWLIVAAVLVLIEILTQMVWTLCLAVGCIGAMIADVAGADLVWQLVVMAVTAVIAFVVLMPLFKKWHDDKAQRDIMTNRTGMDALLGRACIITETIMPDRPGRVKIDGDNWQATAGRGGVPLEAGTEVFVKGYDGNILEVMPTKQEVTGLSNGDLYI